MTGTIPNEYQGNDSSRQDDKKYQGKDDAPRRPAPGAKPFSKINSNKGLNLPCHEAQHPGHQRSPNKNISPGKILLSKKRKIQTYNKQRNNHS